MRIETENAVYQEEKECFFGLVFTKNTLRIEVIDSVHRLMQEADILQHCAYTNEYHMKQEHLLLSAKVDNKVVETIELSIKTMSIIQARGFENHPSKHNVEIKRLIVENIGAIKKRAKNYLSKK